jgi:hypothetical protein
MLRWLITQVWPNLAASLLWVIPGYTWHQWSGRRRIARQLADHLDAIHHRLDTYVDRDHTGS